MKDKTYRDVVIDGSTLEKRRDQRADQLERFIGELDEDDRKGFLGTVNQWTQSEGVKVVDQSESLFDLQAKEKKLRADITDSHTFDAPPVQKRTHQERIEAFALRIKDAPQAEHDAILRQVQGEYWKAGSPVAFEDLRAVAVHFLNQTERK